MDGELLKCQRECNDSHSRKACFVRVFYALFSPSLFVAGWSHWDNWSNCPVTCGRGQRARRRFCLDDDKEEMKGNSTCRGIARETQKCVT